MSDVQVPPDLIAQSLLSLSIDIVQRFRCVSKSLCDIIDDPKFIKSHFLRTKDNRKIIIRHHRRHHISHAPIHVFDIDDPVTRDFGKKNQIHLVSRSFSFFAHCDGLIVLEEGYGLASLIVWNPSIRKCRKLPVLPNKEERKQHGDKGVCFGYDSSIDDYKVMVIQETKGKDANNKPYSSWVIELPVKFRSRTLSYFNNCFVDGAFYFKCSDGVILSFDLAKETFSQVLVLDLKTRFQYYHTHLMVLEGCLCLKLVWGHEVELHVRKKNDGGEFSWTRLFLPKCSIFAWSEVLGFSKDGDKIYLLYDQNDVYSCDFKKKKITRTLSGDRRNHKVYSCIESLVWIEKKKKK